MYSYFFNIGDYAARTRGLTLQQHGIYRLLLDEYYGHEQPLMGTVDTVADSIGAVNEDSRTDVAYVLRRFFVDDGGMFHHTRADEVIANYHDKAPARAAKKEQARERRERHNMQRVWLFQHVQEKGARPAFNASIHDLRDLAARLGIELPPWITERPDASQSASGQHPDASGHHPDTAEDRQNKKHEPITNKDTHGVLTRPDARPDAAARGAAGAVNGAAVCVQPLESQQQTAEAAASTAKRIGLTYANPQDAALAALIGDGANLAAFETAFTEAHAMGKGWGYALGIVRERLRDSQRLKAGQEATKAGQEAGAKAWLASVIAAGHSGPLKGPE